MNNIKIFQSGLIVMGDMLIWKIWKFFQSGENTNDFLKLWKMQRFSSDEKYE